MFKYSLFIKSSCTQIHAYYTNGFLNIAEAPSFNQFSLNVVDVSFVGKTYKWQLKSKCLKLNFNRAHPTTLFFKNAVIFKKFLKTKFRFFIVSNVDVQNIISTVYRIRRYNIFTQRGLKVKGLIIFKKRGKVSTYR